VELHRDGFEIKGDIYDLHTRLNGDTYPQYSDILQDKNNLYIYYDNEEEMLSDIVETFRFDNDEMDQIIEKQLCFILRPE
jgi:hypothetical protein